MTMKNVGWGHKGASRVEFSGKSSGDASSDVSQVPRADILKYIHEMCGSLAYMSNAHNCHRLSDHLEAAAAEAEEQARRADTPFERLKAQTRRAHNDTR